MKIGPHDDEASGLSECANKSAGGVFDGTLVPQLHPRRNAKASTGIGNTCRRRPVSSIHRMIVWLSVEVAKYLLLSLEAEVEKRSLAGHLGRPRGLG